LDFMWATRGCTGLATSDLLRKSHNDLNCGIALTLRHNEPFIRPNWLLPLTFAGAETCGIKA
jgi:hypothetical protein